LGLVRRDRENGKRTTALAITQQGLEFLGKHAVMLSGGKPVRVFRIEQVEDKP
jgi:hypothetical protein